MKKMLTRKTNILYYYKNRKRIEGRNDKMMGDCTWLWGDCTGLWGECTGLWGDCTWLSGNCTWLSGNCTGLWGDCSGLSGNCSGLSGNLDECNLTEKDREKRIKIETLVQVPKKDHTL